ncbi:uncharacterized protein TrAtP1_008411 [Trichoderma atroviride]|uniref:Uncharacterized protein n=1 Tax=Hypocrea atroviridis (strain ATCC 20476 / IMI 206040) TaxID=452589 RepID=G9NZR1_HYPAI|nr:uncharacterized protein TRIATDRAFT_319293 [Trichoderma atroviride IMI 206040]EHK43960.1 hypothetical protein TRIATDRAFT_319293 [Trichoderma atroviride IMI 206040]UKZ67249.1 hypothetical protein TrAtP1_008411 [Trichoderma atroviride]
MPRSGYDLTGTAQGSPASEAAARARQRTASSRTPRAGTPTNPPRQDGDDQEMTPRASRVGRFASVAPMNIHPSFQTGFIPQSMAGPELYQNPLKMSLAQNASRSWMMHANSQYNHGVSPEAQSAVFSRPAVPASASQGIGFVNTQAAYQPINSGAANFRVEQHLFERSGGRLHAMPASQHGFQASHTINPNLQPPFHGFYSQTGTGPSGIIDEDAEMSDADNQSYK